jgi:RimJ/RimL family protein N-acetyltransferase
VEESSSPRTRPLPGRAVAGHSRCQIIDETSAVEDCLAGADWSGSHVTFSIVHPGSGRYAGNIALYRIDRGTAHAKIGCRIARWTRGQGVATSAVRSVTSRALDPLGCTASS